MEEVIKKLSNLAGVIEWSDCGLIVAEPKMSCLNCESAGHVRRMCALS